MAAGIAEFNEPVVFDRFDESAAILVAVSFDADFGYGCDGGFCMHLLRTCALFQLQKRIDDLLPIVEDRAQFAAALVAHSNDVSQRNGLTCQLC